MSNENSDIILKPVTPLPTQQPAQAPVAESSETPPQSNSSVVTPEVRSPASSSEIKNEAGSFEIHAQITQISDDQQFVAISEYNTWHPGEVVIVESKKSGVGIIAFVEVVSVKEAPHSGYLITFALLRHSRKHLVQVGDKVFKLDLSGANTRYVGSTDLMIRKKSPLISSRYKPLITQGLNIGETAQTLWENEFLVTWYGLISYGVTDKLLVSTAIPLDVTGSANLQAKFKFYESDSNVFATGFSFVKIPSEKRSTLNLNLLWDGISSDSQLSHTYLTIALFSFEQAQDATAIKALGTSSFQSGYEFVLDNWDRFLIGPNYNFEKKAVGGYASYVMIWDRFHMAFSANSTNISSFQLSPQDGYYFFFDAYWRY